MAMHRVTGFILAVSIASANWNSGRADDTPNYPRINTASDYVVDPAWPKKPKDFEWGHVPGIVVDSHDHVYVYTRAKPAVQVYDIDGKLLRTWGDSLKEAHHIKIGPDGNVWVSDIGRHVIEKYTPDGSACSPSARRTKPERTRPI